MRRAAPPASCATAPPLTHTACQFFPRLRSSPPNDSSRRLFKRGSSPHGCLLSPPWRGGMAPTLDQPWPGQHTPSAPPICSLQHQHSLHRMCVPCQAMPLLPPLPPVLHHAWPAGVPAPGPIVTPSLPNPLCQNLECTSLLVFFPEVCQSSYVLFRLTACVACVNACSKLGGQGRPGGVQRSSAVSRQVVCRRQALKGWRARGHCTK